MIFKESTAVVSILFRKQVSHMLKLKGLTINCKGLVQKYIYVNTGKISLRFHRDIRMKFQSKFLAFWCIFWLCIVITCCQLLFLLLICSMSSHVTHFLDNSLYHSEPWHWRHKFCLIFQLFVVQCNMGLFFLLNEIKNGKNDAHFNGWFETFHVKPHRLGTS